MQYVSTALMAAALLVGCNKADEQQSKEDILRGNAWRLSSSRSVQFNRATMSYDSVNRYIDVVPQCVKDNTLKFDIGYQGTKTYGGDLCSSGGAGQVPFEWSLYNGDNNLRIYNAEESFLGNGSINAELLVLATNRFVIRYQEIAQDAPSNLSDTLTITNVYSR